MDIGMAFPTALLTINANAERGLASARDLFPDMPLLH
jgi:hypothetical protein